MAQATMSPPLYDENIFERWNVWIRGFEGSAVNLASAVAPWLAPLTPAYMTFDHSVKVLGFDWWIAFTNAVVVELLGLSAVNTGLNFYFFNRRNQAARKQAPLGIVVFSFLFYLLVIVTSNVLLDAFAESSSQLFWAKIVVRAGFTLQTIPAALIIVARTGHKDMLNELAVERERQRSERLENARKDKPDSPLIPEPEIDNTMPGNFKSYVFQLLDQNGYNMPLTEITRLVNEAHGVTIPHERAKGTWYKFKQEWQRLQAVSA